MNILLDTHILIWALEDSDRLSDKARELIINPANGVFVSAASVWEITIKTAIGKLSVPDNLLEEIESHQFTPLSIDFVHAYSVKNYLTYIRIHSIGSLFVRQFMKK